MEFTDNECIFALENMRLYDRLSLSANLTGLEASFKREFYGQHLATRVLLSSIKGHLKTKGSKPLVLSLHGWTGTGKNFATELIAQHLFKHGIHSNFIYKFIIPLHFPHQSLAALYRSQLQQWITSNVTRCSKGGLFVFDEMDKIPQGIVDVLKPFLDARGNHFCKMIFVFLSNTGAKLINQHALEHYKLGDEREKIGLVTLEELFHQISESDPNIWYNDLLRSEVIDHFVPFLPLERKHVKQCIQRDLRDKGNPAVEGLVDHIADEMTYFPEREKLFSISGCKKVSSKVDVAVG
ncbi:predicted protein [Nematostella vectensis]|uniref:Torsin-1A C-terminal domain-containing protein n=1 Tax=Nematostella vectensis TaxID=45351 RepID=A7RP69_NEMVE|nr:predicted protein [Nematostella vectensis]|eukprot:XP_001638871.1 predicted protein [Nematostella vectensis]